MVDIKDDLISVIIQMVAKAANENGGITDSIAMEIESQVRNDWAGEQVYIARNHAERIARRNEKIYEAYWDKGQRDIRQLATRFGLTDRQIRRIVFGD